MAKLVVFGPSISLVETMKFWELANAETGFWSDLLRTSCCIANWAKGLEIDGGSLMGHRVALNPSRIAISKFTPGFQRLDELCESSSKLLTFPFSRNMAWKSTK